ncbi:hypothetical protein Riv7116_6108 [Rivularia sp. PCC 7116]|uniref:formylglycine-generating enzyme family protein n=1 Tax=Rivularia sp. PCC 7116 TaxID=373994 RepID=UPI00029F2688|nr:formylglycine-generating enzyme family protein [Rivularia sp. PCC 7116]AFY58464.1 hypothetical protein Riv7116_6108 [Rivularia sp. PCC 7116]
MKSSATNNQFNQLIAALGTDLELTGEQIADIIWFSQKRLEISNIQNDTPSQSKNKSNTPEKLNIPPTNTPANLNTPPINTPTPAKPASAEIYPKTQEQTQEKPQTSSKNKPLPLRVPDAPSLREPLTLAQVLKPLMRRVESGRKTVLDETATVERTAAERICIPILKSEPEPWLDVALVVDESKSMLIWRHTIWELKKLLEHYGVFRDVRAWGLVTDENGQIYIRPGIGKNALQQRLASHREILDPNRRRLILLASDCVAAIWRNGAINQVLTDWTNAQPVAIIQMLPDWLWLKTGLGLGTSVNLASLTPGIANKHLLVKKQLLWKDINLNTGIKIPVFTLEPDKALPWSQMVAGKSDAVASGFVLSSAISSKPSHSKQATQTTIPQINPQERVYRFRMTASPMGRKLAGLLAAAPVINLPVVRLIQETLLPESRQVHVAEVFLGGLLKPLTPIEADTLPDTVQYDFMDDEIRGILLESAPVKDSADIFNAVSLYVAAELGKSLQDFVALLKAPEEADSEQVKPFAEVAIKILKRLGGEYGAFAEEIEGKSQTDTENIEKSEVIKGFPPLQNFEFRIRTVSFQEKTADINLQTFTFESATIELRKSEGDTEVIIHRHLQQSQYFIEDLGNGIELEMVLIPDGTFTMGAPEHEKGSDNSERPQHRATVPSFFIGKYQVTQAQWRVVANLPQVERKLKLEPSLFKGDNLPVEKISWYDAVEFCARLSNHTGKKYRLPSEAEWEYACRAGTTTPFHFGETITSELANYRANKTFADEPKGEYREQTTPAGQFPPNSFGLHDMHGNVWEWCLDYYHGNHEGAPIDGSAWIDPYNYNNDNRYRVLRGGSWFNIPGFCRSAFRYVDSPDVVDLIFGLRVACGVAP